MNPKESPEITVQTLLALRQESNALQVITDKLRVKEMGPADHIRTKHEAKAFMENGDVEAAKSLIKQASERIVTHHAITHRIAEQQQHGRRMGS